MGRSTKLIFIILLLLLMIYPMFSTSYTAIGNPDKVIQNSNIVVGSQDDITPPEKPDGLEGEKFPDMYDDQMNIDEYNDGTIVLEQSTSKYIYYVNATSVVLLIFEAFIFSVCLCYLIFTDFCKKDIKTVFSENRAIVYAYSLISFCVGHAISLGLLYLIQNIITNKY